VSQIKEIYIDNYFILYTYFLHSLTERQKHITCEHKLWMYVWLCILYETDVKYQLDATIVVYHHKISLHVLGIWRWAYRCPKHVETFCDNKLQLLHEVRTSHQLQIMEYYHSITPASFINCVFMTEQTEFIFNVYAKKSILTKSVFGKDSAFYWHGT
jgi:hypothetical protein